MRIAVIAVVLVAAALMSFALTAAIRRFAINHAILDVPNERSSHVTPTPRGGGLAIVVVAIIAIVVNWALGNISGSVSLTLVTGGLLIAAIGMADDRRHVPRRWRMLVHVIAACLVVYLSWGDLTIEIAGWRLGPGWFGSAVALLYIVWLVNLYNFMDGIDGIAGLEAVSVAACAAILYWRSDEPGFALLVAAVGASSLGFPAWNWPPAKIFMGDVGSSFLGFLFGALTVISHATTPVDVYVWLILLGVFVVDATFTLLRRIVTRQPFFEAHRSHAYQNAALRYGSHVGVTSAVVLINLVWLFPVAWLVQSGAIAGVTGLGIAYGPLLAFAIAYRAGRASF